MVEVIMVDEVLDVIEQEVSAKLARDARAGEIAELCAEQLAINRQHHLERCAQAIERQLAGLH